MLLNRSMSVMIKLHGRFVVAVRPDELGQHAVELGPVGDLRERILGRQLVQALAALFERDLRRDVVQQ